MLHEVGYLLFLYKIYKKYTKNMDILEFPYVEIISVGEAEFTRANEQVCVLALKKKVRCE